MIVVKMGTHLIFKYIIPLISYKISKRNYFKNIQKNVEQAKKNLEIIKIQIKEKNLKSIKISYGLVKSNNFLKLYPKIFEPGNYSRMEKNIIKIHENPNSINLEEYKKKLIKKKMNYIIILALLWEMKIKL